MRTMMVSLVVLSAATSLVWSQVPSEPGAKPGSRSAKPAAADASVSPTSVPSLEELLTTALKTNPDIRMAEIKLREAEAELARVRLQVTQKIINYRHELTMQQRLAEEAQVRYNTSKKLVERGGISQEDLRSALLTLQRYKAEVARVESELPFLLGQQPEAVKNVPYLRSLGLTLRGAAEAEGVLKVKVELVPATVAEKLRKALDKPVTIRFERTILPLVLKEIEQKTDGVRILASPDVHKAEAVDLEFPHPVPLGAVIQALEDVEGCRFFIRQYGLFVTTAKQTPPGAIPLHEFWMAESHAPKKNPPAAEPKQ